MGASPGSAGRRCPGRVPGQSSQIGGLLRQRSRCRDGGEGGHGCRLPPSRSCVEPVGSGVGLGVGSSVGFGVGFGLWQGFGVGSCDGPGGYVGATTGTVGGETTSVTGTVGSGIWVGVETTTGGMTTGGMTIGGVSTGGMTTGGRTTGRSTTTVTGLWRAGTGAGRVEPVVVAGVTATTAGATPGVGPPGVGATDGVGGPADEDFLCFGTTITALPLGGCAGVPK